MPTIQRLSPGVTATWAGDTPKQRRRRRAGGTSGAVSVRHETVRSPLPASELLAAVRQGISREQIAALLSHTARPGTHRGDVDTRLLANQLMDRGIPRETVLLALLDFGQSDTGALAAVWGGTVAEVRRLVRVLLRDASWSGDRLMRALGAIGVSAPDRVGLFEPVSGSGYLDHWCSGVRCGSRCAACGGTSTGDSSGEPATDYRR